MQWYPISLYGLTERSYLYYCLTCRVWYDCCGHCYLYPSSCSSWKKRGVVSVWAFSIRSKYYIVKILFQGYFSLNHIFEGHCRFQRSLDWYWDPCRSATGMVRYRTISVHVPILVKLRPEPNGTEPELDGTEPEPNWTGLYRTISYQTGLYRTSSVWVFLDCSKSRIIFHDRTGTIQDMLNRAV